jgi:TolB protein
MLVVLLLLFGVPALAADGPPGPFPDDPRCGNFGWRRGDSSPLMPVAFPVVQDLTLHGDLSAVSDRLSRVLARDLDLAGPFLVLPADSRPEGSEITWYSGAGFDYVGWREAGAYLVPIGEVEPGRNGLVHVSLVVHVSEEGDTLGLGGATADLEPDRIEGFVHRFVNALAACIRGVPGLLETRIAYARREAVGKPKEIFYSVLGSGSQVQVSRDGVVAMLPAWTPNGGIAFTGYRAGNPDLYLCAVPKDAPGRCDRFSSRPGQNSGVAFSPDGKLAAATLAPEGNPDVWLLDAANGAEVARLTTSAAIDTSPSWSPDGRRLAFVSDRDGGPQIWVMNADGTAPHPLPLPGGYNTSPDWSPDGDLLAYQSRGEGSRFSIWTFQFSTGAVRRLSGGPWDDEEPTWSPDGSMLAYTSTRRGAKLLFLMSEDGSGQKPVFTDGGDYFTPAWERVFYGKR